MGVNRQNRPSEDTLDAILRSVRNLDKLLWLGEPRRLDDIRDEADCIKWQLDQLIKQFEQERPLPPPAPSPTLTEEPSPHGPAD